MGSVFLAEVSFNNFVDDGFDFFCCLDVLFLLELIDSNLILVLIEFPKWHKPVAVANNYFRECSKSNESGNASFQLFKLNGSSVHLCLN